MTAAPTTRPWRTWSITDQRARALVRSYAYDLCVCGHDRDHHADRSGAARRCQVRACACVHYAWQEATS